MDLKKNCFTQKSKKIDLVNIFRRCYIMKNEFINMRLFLFCFFIIHIMSQSYLFGRWCLYVFQFLVSYQSWLPILSPNVNYCYSRLSISQILVISNFLVSRANVFVPCQTTKANNYSVLQTLVISNRFLIPLRVQDIESQLYFLWY